MSCTPPCSDCVNYAIERGENPLLQLRLRLYACARDRLESVEKLPLVKLLAILIALGIYLFASRSVTRTIQQLGRSKQVAPFRIKYISKTTNIALFMGFLLLVFVLLGIGYGELSVFFSSVFAVIGIALFAQWSILSNITASVAIFFGFPYRVGDQIKITDSDFDLSGTLEEIGLFHVLIRSREGNVITYPNSLILQKPVIKLDGGNREFPQKLGTQPRPAVPRWKPKDRG